MGSPFIRRGKREPVAGEMVQLVSGVPKWRALGVRPIREAERVVQSALCANIDSAAVIRSPLVDPIGLEIGI